MASATMTRSDDIRALHILRAAQRGENLSELAKRLGKSTGYARTIGQRVMAADIAESGEPTESVRSAYIRCE